MAETLTVLRLGLPPTLARTFRSTNAVESMISICRDHAGNVKRWRDGQMALRWCAAGMAEAGKQFRRVNGHLHRARCGHGWNGSPNLSVPPAMMGRSRPPNDHRAAAEFHGLRDILCVSLGCYVEAYRTWVAVVMGYLGHFRYGRRDRGRCGGRVAARTRELSAVS